MHVETFNGHSMTGELLRVMVCPPRNAGWKRTGCLASSRELGFRREPDFSVAQEQHDDLCRLLTEAGAELLCLPASKSLTLDAVYTHDASLATDWGLILMNPGKPNRLPEARAHADYCAHLRKALRRCARCSRRAESRCCPHRFHTAPAPPLASILCR